MHDEQTDEQIRVWWPRGRFLFVWLGFLVAWSTTCTYSGYTYLYEDSIRNWSRANCFPRDDFKAASDEYDALVLNETLDASPMGGEHHELYMRMQLCKKLIDTDGRPKTRTGALYGILLKDWWFLPLIIILFVPVVHLTFWKVVH
jgi:hypothetical protein